MFGRDTSERFKSSLPSPGISSFSAYYSSQRIDSPGPGDYDPNHPDNLGYKADPNSGFRGSGRFSNSMNEDGSGTMSQMSLSPRRRIPSRPGSRTTDWTSNRIKDLETELRISKAKIIELQQVIRESGMTRDQQEELESELREVKNKLLEQKGTIAAANREKGKAEGELKRMETEMANLTLRAKKADESRKIAEAKVAETKLQVSELEKQIDSLKANQSKAHDDLHKEIKSLKKQLTAAEASASSSTKSHGELNAQIMRLQAQVASQKEQLSAKDDELSASKSAEEALIVENLAEILAIKAELTVAGEREAEKDGLIEKLRAEIQDLKDRLDSVLNEKAELESELQKMREDNEAKATQLESLTKDIEQARNDLHQRDQMVQELESNLSSIQEDKSTTLDSLKAAEDQIEKLKTDLDFKSQEVDVMEGKIMAITQELGEDFTEEEDQDLEKKLEKFTSVIATTQHKITDLEKLTADQVPCLCTRLAAECFSQESELKHLGNKVAIVLKEKKAKVQELERQKKEEKSLRRAMDEQENNMNYLNSQLEVAEAKMKEDEETNSKLQSELVSVRLQLGEKTVEAADLKEKADSLAKEISEVGSDRETKDKTISDLQSDLENVKTELQARESRVQELESRIDQVGKTVGKKGSSLAELEVQLKELGKERDSLQSTLETCKKDLSKSKADSKKKDEALSDLKKEVSRLESKLSKTLESKKKAEENAEQARKQKSDIEEKLSRSKAAYKSAQATVASQTEELAKLHSLKRQLETQLSAVNVNQEKGSDQMTKKVANLQKSLRDREEEIRELQSELGSVSKSTQNVQGDNQKTQAKLVKAENEARKKAALVHDLSEQMKSLEQENKDLVRDYERAESIAKSKLADREKKLQRLERELSQLKEKYSQPMAEERDVDSSEAELRAEMKRQQKKYESEIRALRLEPTNIRELRSEASAARAVSHTLRKENEALRAELRETKERLSFFEYSNPSHDEELDEMERLKEALREAERKVIESQKLAAHYKSQMKRSETLKLEMERLEEENMHLHTRTNQLTADVSGLMNSSGNLLGHYNGKQRIQYHLKLKKELEELRQQYTALSRDKFKLEQAVRYMAARADLMTGNGESNVGGTAVRLPSYSMAPPSTKESAMMCTPSGKRHMKWASRARGTTDDLSAYKKRDSMVREIEEAQIATEVEAEAFKHDVSVSRGINSSDPAIRPLSEEDSVEKRILSTISSVVSGRRRRKSLVD